MDVGTRLLEARQRRGLRLDDVAASTKISRQTLQHIEQNQFHRLPGGIVTRGFLRGYAAEVGLDPEPIVRDYLAQCFGESGETLPIAPRPALERETHSGRLLLIEIVVVALAFGLYEWDRHSADVLADQPLASEAPLSSSAVASITDAVMAQTSTADQELSSLRIEIRATGPCWVVATADDRVVVQRLLQRGEVESTTATQELVLRVGDPNAFEYWLNGAPGRSLGEGGRPVTVRITVDNVESFLNDSEDGTEFRSPTKTT